MFAFGARASQSRQARGGGTPGRPARSAAGPVPRPAPSLLAGAGPAFGLAPVQRVIIGPSGEVKPEKFQAIKESEAYLSLGDAEQAIFDQWLTDKVPHGPYKGNDDLLLAIAEEAKRRASDRIANLDYQYETEEKLVADRDAYVASATKLFAAIKAEVPDVDMAPVAGARYAAELALYKTESRQDDRLNLPAGEYRDRVEAILNRMRQRLALSTPEAVAPRGEQWAELRGLYPEAAPFLLISPQWDTVVDNLRARIQLGKRIPKRVEFADAMVALASKEPVEPAEVRRQAEAYYDTHREQIGSAAHAISPELATEAYQHALQSIVAQVQAVTPPSASTVEARKQSRDETAHLLPLTGFDLVRPDFAALRERVLANDQTRATILKRLPDEWFPKEPFVKELLARSKFPNNALIRDAEELYAEKLARIQRAIMAVSLRLPDAEYMAEMQRVIQEVVLYERLIPGPTRRYHALSADDKPAPHWQPPDQKSLERLRKELGYTLTIVGAKAEQEKLYIENLVQIYFLNGMLDEPSEHHLISQIGPDPGEEQPAPVGKITIIVHEKDDVLARLVERRGDSPADVTDSRLERERIMKRLVDEFQLDPFAAEGGGKWSAADLTKLQLALARLPAEDRVALAGLAFVRVKTLDKDEKEEGRTLGVFTVRPVNRKIKLADVAFSGDLTAFAGPPHDVSTKSTQTILHETGHAVEHKQQLDARRKHDEIVGKSPPPVFLDPEVADLEQRLGESDLGTKLSLSFKLLEFASVLKSKAQQAGKTPEWQLVQKWHTAAAAFIDAPGRLTWQPYNQLDDAVAEAKPAIAKLFGDEVETLRAAILKFAEASSGKGKLQVQLEAAKKKAQARLDEYGKTVEAAKAVLAEATSSDGKLSKRLENFMQLVKAYELAPNITAYAEASWKEGKYGEFFAEAYSLWLTDPDYLRLNFQPIYVWFKLGHHRQ